jgi:hypothetical protein
MDTPVTAALVEGGLTSVSQERVRAGGGFLEVLRVQITGLGRKALSGR